MNFLIKKIQISLPPFFFSLEVHSVMVIFWFREQQILTVISHLTKMFPFAVDLKGHTAGIAGLKIAL